MSSGRSGEVLAGRFELGDLVAIQGLEGCEDSYCGGQAIDEQGRRYCTGYHCAVCLKPSGLTGHAACRGET